MTIDDLIDRYAEDLDFDALEGWCSILGVAYDPPLDDDWPDWEDELRAQIADAMRKVGKEKK